MSKMTMKDFFERLPSGMFARTHRSYIINITKPLSYSNNKMLTGNVLLPVGMHYQAGVRKIFGVGTGPHTSR